MQTEDDELRLCEIYYAQAVAGAVSDEEELAIALELLQKARGGMVVTDNGAGLIYASNPNLPVDAEWMVDGQDARQRRQQVRQALIIGAGVVVALVLVFVMYGGGGSGGKATATPAATEHTLRPVSIATQTLTPTITPVPSVTPVPSATPSPSPVPAKEVEVKAPAPTLEPGAVVPVSLEIAGRYYPIVPTTLRQDVWAYQPDPGQVSWLAGSYVNIVLGLPYSQANLDLVATTLHISDTLTLRNNMAGVNHYRVTSRQSVSVYEIEALGQRRAGLTLVLLGGNDENPASRLVVWAVPQDRKEAGNHTP